MAFKPHDDYGLLWRALAISLLLHGLLLLQPGVGSGSSPAAGAKSLIARIRPGTLSASTGAPVAVPVLPAVQAPLHTHATPATPSASVAKMQTQSEFAAVTAGVVAGSAAGSATSSATPASNIAATVASSADTDFAEGKKSYLFAIAAEARRVKKYPPRALAAGWTGTTEIRIAVTAGGNVLPPQLQKSSGHAEIDDAALSLVGIALKRTPVPENLRARNFEFVLPVSFSINGE